MHILITFPIITLLSTIHSNTLRRFPVPLVTTGSGKRRPDAEGRCWVPFRGSCKRGRVREGEGGYQLRGRPSNCCLPFCTILATISTFKNSVEKTVPKREPMGTPKEAQGRCRGGSYRFWYHFHSHLGSFLGAHGPLKNS